MSLTDVDRRMIAKAREVAALKDAAAMRERYGEWGGEDIADSEMARAAALGEAQFVLLELVAIVERLDGQAAQADPPPV